MSALTPQMTSAFDQITGMKTPPAGAPAQSWADKLTSLAGSKYTAPTPAPTPEPSFGSRVSSDIQSAANDVNANLNAPVTTGMSGIKNATGAVSAAFGAVPKVASELLPQSIRSNFTNPDVQAKVQRFGPGLIGLLSNNKALQTLASDPKNQDTVNKLSDVLETVSNVGNISGTIAGAQGATSALESVPKITEGVINAASDTGEAVSNTAKTVKEFVKPSLTPEEEVGKVIQGKTSDIPAAQRTFESLPSQTPPVTKMEPQALSDTIQNKIDANMKAVDAHYANDTIPHKMSEFEQTVGKGTSAVKSNYVQQAIDQLKTHYTATNDAEGLSKIKALEEKANTEGLTSKELNDLAKEHGSEMPKAFSKTNEPLSGLNKQATENTRAGVKATARDMLSKTNPEGAAEVTKLDRNTADAIKTKSLLDKQVERAAVTVQKKGKLGAVGRLVKKHPLITGAVSGTAAYGTAKRLGIPLP